MEESIDSLTQCHFKDTNIIDKIRQCTIEFSLDPPSFEESKNTIISAIQALENEKTNKMLLNTITNMLIRASLAYTDEIWELFKPKLEKIRTIETFPNKSCILIVFIHSIYDISEKYGFPKEKEFVDFYEICYNETKKVSPDFSKIVSVYGVKIPANTLVKIAVLTQKPDFETIKHYISVLFTPEITDVGCRLFTRESADLFLKCAPNEAFTLSNILKLGKEKAIQIIEDEMSESFIYNLADDFDKENSDYDIAHAILLSLIRNDDTDIAANFIDIIRIQDVTENIVDFCSENDIFLPQSVLSQITDYSIIPELLPALESLDFVPEEELNKIITEYKDNEKISSILMLSPRCSVLNDVDFWIELAKKNDSCIHSFGKVIIINIPDINDHIAKIIKELDPNKAMRILNSILEERVQCFASFIQKPEYIELLNVTDIPIYTGIARELDLSFLPFKELDEETPAPIWFLLASSSCIEFTFKQPVLPTLTDEENGIINKTLSVEGNKVMRIIAYVLLIPKASKQKILYRGLNETNKLAFVSLALRRIGDLTLLTETKVFEETDAPLTSMIDVTADMKGSQIELLFGILERSNNKLENVYVQIIEKMYSFKYNDKSKTNCLRMAKIVNRLGIQKVFEENYEQIINCLYEGRICLNRALCDKNAKNEIYDFIHNKSKTDDGFRKYFEGGFSKHPIIHTVPNKINNKKVDELQLAEIRKKNPMEQILMIVNDTPSAELEVVEYVIDLLFNDNETNAQCLQFLLGKIFNELIVPIPLVVKAFANFLNKQEALAKVIDSLFTLGLEKQDILIKRAKPIELPPPSKQSIEIVDAALNICKEKPSFNAFKLLFFIARFYLPLFRFVKMPHKDIIELCFAAKHDSTEFSPFFAAAAFLECLLEQPQFADEFFEFVFEKIEKFDEFEILMATTMILLRLTRKKTCIATFAVLIKNKFLKIAAGLLEKRDIVCNDAIFSNINCIIASMYSQLNTIPKNAAYSYHLIMKEEKIFTACFGSLLVNSMSGDRQITSIQFFMKNVFFKLFSYKSNMSINSHYTDTRDLMQIITSINATPEEEIDPLPDSVDPETYKNYSLLMKSKVLREIVYRYNVTPEILMLAFTEERYVLSVLSHKEAVLLTPSHYLKVLRIIKESEKVDKADELSSLKALVLELHRPEAFNAVVRIPFTQSRSLIIKMMKNPTLEKAVIISAINSIKTLPREQFFTCISIISLMSDNGGTKEIVARFLPKMVELYLLFVSGIDADVFKNVVKIIAKVNVFPERIIHLIGLSIFTPKYEEFAIDLYALLPKELKEESGYIIEAAFRKALDHENEMIRTYLNKCPELAKTYSSDLLKLADKYLQGNNRSNFYLAGFILSALSPEPCSASISSLSVEAKAGEDTSLPISPLVRAQNPDFWNVVQKNIAKIREIIFNNQSLLNTTFSFMKRFPTLIPLDKRAHALRDKLCSSALVESSLILEIDRNHILEDTFNAIESLPASKLLENIKIKFKDEKGVDQGGLLREWFTEVIAKIFDPESNLFIITQNKLSYQPNVESSCDQQSLNYFKMTGRLVARAVIAGISVPAYFSQGILKCILKHNLTLEDLKYVDKTLYNSLLFLRDNDADKCDITFERTMQGSKQVYTKPLKKDGENIPVTNENKEEYIQLMINDVLYDQAKQQIDAIVAGFHEIIPIEELRMFNSRELNLIISGLPQISIDDLEANTKLEPPYTKNWPTIKALFNVLRKWDDETRGMFLLFVTGCSRPPVGGFSALENKFTISRLHGIKHFPIAHTCSNGLELPDYNDEALLESKLLYAIQNTETFELG